MVDLEVVVRVVGIVLEALPVTRVPVLAVVDLEVVGVVVLEVVVSLPPLPLVAFEGVAGGIDDLGFVREMAGIGFIVDFV